MEKERINMTQWAESILKNHKRIALPIMTHPGIEMIGEKIVSAVRNGEVHAEAILALQNKYPSAAVTAIMDLTVEAECFGCDIEFPDEDMPHIMKRLVSSEQEIEQLKVPDIHTARMPEYLKANRIVTETIREVPVFAGAIGPFSLAGRLYDLSEIMIACYLEPDTIHLLLEKCTAFIQEYCRELKKIGCNGVIIAEPAAGLLSNEDCEVFSSTYVGKIVKELQDDEFMIVLHNCGNQGQCTDAMLSTGAAALHFGNAIDIATALEKCPKNILVMGNLDPVGVLKVKSAEDVKVVALDLLKRTSNHKNFILSTGCDLPPRVPLANIEAFYAAVEEYNNPV